MNIIRLVFITLAVVLFNAYLIYSTMKSANKPKFLHTIYLKILVNYFQLVYLVTQFRLNWPDPVLQLLHAQNNTGGVAQHIYSIDCFLSNNQNSSDVFYIKQIFMAVLPFGVFLLIMLFWVVRAWMTGQFRYLNREMTASLVIAFFFLHPTLTTSLFSVFSCTKVSAGQYWLTEDMAIPCWDSQHIRQTFLVGIPAVVVWVFAVPLLCLGILIRNRREQDEVWVKMQYGFLITGYRRETYYWEFVILFRKIAVICCSVFITNTIPIQALAVQLILAVCFFLQFSVAPYFSLHLNAMEVRAILVADVTIYCGLFYLTDKLSSFGSWLFFACIVVSNVVFLVYWVKVFLGYTARMALRMVPILGSWLHIDPSDIDEDIEDFIRNSSLKTTTLSLSDSKSVYRAVLRPQLNAAKSV